MSATSETSRSEPPPPAKRTTASLADASGEGGMTGPTLSEKPHRSFYERHERVILGSIAVVIALAGWQAMWSAGKISPLFFTGPSQVVVRFGEEWTMGRLKQDMIYSGRNFIIGVGGAIAVGVVVGVIIG